MFSSAAQSAKQCLQCRGSVTLLFDSHIDIAVTSDCHPVQGRIYIFQCDQCSLVQKHPDETYLATLKRIYEDYQIYEVSGGHEQVKFVNGVPRARSDIILDNIGGMFPSKGRFLDVGTGSGVFLRALSKRFQSDVSLYAQDIHGSEEDAVLKIPYVKQFYRGDIKSIEEQFDAISLIHVFEHVLSPIDFLKLVKERLRPGGVMIVQVPNIEEAPFDAVIYDHVFHYSRKTLVDAVGRVFRHCWMPENQLNNEITLVASDSADRIGPEGSQCAAAKVDLTVVEIATNYLMRVTEEMAVFGVSPPGSYCGAVLGEKLVCFVDEDKNIRYKTHLNHRIIPPEDVNTNLRVFLPPNRNASQIRSRLVNLRFVEVNDVRGA